ncbi:MAG: hypothetical protein AB7F96_03350 [Beijerinckiaceae bacterium]
MREKDGAECPSYCFAMIFLAVILLACIGSNSAYATSAVEGVGYDKVSYQVSEAVLTIADDGNIVSEGTQLDFEHGSCNCYTGISVQQFFTTIKAAPSVRKTPTLACLPPEQLIFPQYKPPRA